jgi:pimeloyl-ACP methyl ester carboxylesterase
MPYTDSDDVRIYFESFGSDTHPVIVLISGGGAQMLSWREDFIALFVAEGFRVIRFDNRDTGLSQRFGGPADIDGGYELSDMGDDIVRVLDSLDIDTAHIVGHSMGGMMAQMVALDHPERVRSLGLLSTIPGQDTRWVLHGERTDLMGPPQRFARDVLIESSGAYAQTAGSARYPIDVEWMRWAAGEAYDRGYFPEGFSRQWAALLRAPERLERLRAVTVPAFVFHGREDDVLHWSSAVDISDALALSDLQVHHGVGHLIPPGVWPALVDGIVRTARLGETLAAG